MIIRSVLLNPFGGLSYKKIELENGLNVVIGPNEVGKSTIYNGIQKALFIPSKLNKKDFENEIKDYIPVGGGDTAKVEIQLLHNEKLYILKKAWGGSRASEIYLPDGNPISEETAVNEKLRSLLAAGAGTYRSVLMIGQSGLAKTLGDLHKNHEPVNYLGEVIRKTVLETDGVSVEKFKDEIEKLYGDYFNHWDRTQDFPENNRGTENQHKQKVGRVLKAFYDKDTLKSKLKMALFYDEELDKINTNLRAYELEIAKNDSYLMENEKAVSDARNRKNKSLEFELKEIETSQLINDSKDWVIAESENIKLSEELPYAVAKLDGLEKERSKAKIKAENESLIRMSIRVEECKKERESAEEALKSVKKLEDAELKSIGDALNEVERLKASIEAGKLRASFEAKKALTLNIQKDLEEEYLREVIPGESFLLEAGGRLKFEHPEWKIEISSGEEETAKVLHNYEAAETQKEDLLNQYGIQSLKEAQELNRKYNAALNNLINATYNFEKELGDTSYYELLQKMEKINTECSSEEIIRPLDEILQEHARLEGEINRIRKQLKDNEEKVKELTSKYETEKKLLIKLGKASNYKDELEKEIKELSPLPEGMVDDQTFILKYESVDKQLKIENSKRLELLRESLNLKKEAPEETAEELDKQQNEAEADFLNVLRKAEAVARIRDLTEKLLADIDSGTYKGLKKELENYISFITSGRYNSVEMEEGKSLPCGFVRDDGEFLDYELLSTGTKDVLSLALRISMANYFLKGASGFLIMDDPFVDMDPERQQKAGQIIRKFAEEKQVIIFTCHPTHAKILGGNQIHI